MELNILYAINSIHTPLLDKIMIFITHLGDAGFLWILLCGILILVKRTRKIGLTVGLSLILVLILGNSVLKPLIMRPRPFTHAKDIALLIPAPSDYSFPSGHTYASFACATVLFIYSRKAGIACAVAGALIAFSRMYLFVHYPTDILGGVILGIVCGIAAFKLMSLIDFEKNRIR